MREPMYIPFASRPHKKYRPGGRRSRNDLRDRGNDHHGSGLRIFSTNPKVEGIDGAVRSFVEYLYALA